THKESLKILSPIESVRIRRTVEMSGEKYVTGSKVIPIVHCLNNIISRLDPCNAIAEKLENNILDQINMRLKNSLRVEKNYFLSIATLLDPRFKKLHFTSIVDCTKAITRVSNLMKRRTNVEDKENQVDCFRTPPPHKSGILSVWNFHDELSYNDNAKNCGDNIISEKRSRLSSNRVSTLIFLNSLKNKYWEL
ncbi:hypothetical protein ALC57_08794, partial [Trachymyrmex cornetzi]